jgi:hypothetical protein
MYECSQQHCKYVDHWLHSASRAFQMLAASLPPAAGGFQGSSEIVREDGPALGWEMLEWQDRASALLG